MADLTPYLLQRVDGLEGSLRTEEGHGAFGVVYKVTVNGLPCIAKCLHQILVKEVSYDERVSMESKFRNECMLLSKLKHPNIVHFIGVHYGRSENDLALVMERLHTDTAAFVKSHPKLPVSIMVSIMLDVSYGLLYLHTQTPPIIHRDLTAPNVLLTSDLRAKIADLGVSKVLMDTNLIKHTTAPGNVNYMAPETKTQNPVYGTSVDIFSSGHLIIHIAIQDWPKLYKVTDHLSIAPGQTEIAERRSALDNGMGKDHCLYDLALDCLQDNPKNRPTTFEFNKRVNEISMKHPKQLEDMYQVEASEDTASARVRELSDLAGRQLVEIEQLQQERTEILTQIETHQLAAQMYRDDFQSERKDRETAHSKLADMEGQRLSLQNELSDRTHQVEELHSALTKKNNEVSQLQREKEDLLSRLPLVEEKQRTVSREDAAVAPLPHSWNSLPSQPSLQHSLSFPPDSVEPKECPDHQQLPSPAHMYVNIRDEASSRQQYYATLATIPQATSPVVNPAHYNPSQAPVTLLTPPDIHPTVPMRNRASTESTIKYSPLSASNSKTLPPKFRNQGGKLLLAEGDEGYLGDVFGGRPTGEELSRQRHDFAVSRPEPSQQPHTLSPVTRDRSHAISKSNLDLPQGDVSPRPPVRHQSLSRVRSNPNKDVRVEDSSVHPYERVPPRFDQSLSAPDTTVDTSPQRRQTASPILRQPQRPTNFIPEGRVYQLPDGAMQSMQIRSRTPSPTRSRHPYRSQDEYATSRTNDPLPVRSKFRQHSDPSPPLYENIRLSSNVAGDIRFQIITPDSEPDTLETSKPYQNSSSSTAGNSQTSEKHSAVQGNDWSMYASTATGYDQHWQPNFQRSSIDLPPLDPNLVCPVCAQKFRVGEIQDYRSHYKTCLNKAN